MYTIYTNCFTCSPGILMKKYKINIKIFYLFADLSPSHICVANGCTLPTKLQQFNKSHCIDDSFGWTYPKGQAFINPFKRGNPLLCRALRKIEYSKTSPKTRFSQERTLQWWQVFSSNARMRTFCILLQSGKTCFVKSGDKTYYYLVHASRRSDKIYQGHLLGGHDQSSN